MRILDVQEFKSNQYELQRERRTSQHTRFLDKNVDFVTYYNINKTLSTTSYKNGEVDSYIGADSPIRYNRINNMPIYGFPIIDTVNSYDETEGGFNGDDFEGSIIILQEIIEPYEGDCFILNMFSEHYFFMVTAVEQITMKSKPYYNVRFIIGKPDYMSQLNKQVVEEYNALFDNIGTQDRVIVSKNEYDLAYQFKKIYEEMVNYYIAKFFNSKITMFELSLPVSSGVLNKFTDKFLIHFMESNRIITFDSVLESTFVLDYNNLSDSGDLLEYKKTIYWAIENKDMRKFVPAKYVTAKKIASPFTLLKGQTDEEYFTSESFSVSEPEFNKFFFEFPFEDVSEKWKANDLYSNESDVYSRVLSLIMNYLKGNIMLPGYFSDIIGEMDPIKEYVYIPVILFIIRSNINGLMTSKISL